MGIQNEMYTIDYFLVNMNRTYLCNVWNVLLSFPLLCYAL